MKIRITPTILDQVAPAIADALARVAKALKPDPTDPIYLKISAAAGEHRGPGHFIVDADELDVRELKSRFEYELETCAENIPDCYAFSDRAYWMGRKRAAEAILKQLNS